MSFDEIYDLTAGVYFHFLSYIPRLWHCSSSGTLVYLYLSGCSLGIALFMLAIVEYMKYTFIVDCLLDR